MKRWFLHSAVLFFAFALVMSLYASPAFSAQTPDPLETINRALGLAEQGDAAGARKTLIAITDANTPDPLLCSARGIIELMTGNVGDAEPFFRTALAQNPQQLASVWGLSLCALQRAHVYEAAALVDRAAVLAPENVHIKALHAYTYLLLGQISDAAVAGKEALDGEEKSPFLMATLAQIHYRIGLPKKAVEFSSFSAKYLYGLDLSKPPAGIYLPLTMTSTDTPAALTGTAAAPNKAAEKLPAATDIVPPAATPEVDQPRFAITEPVKDTTVCGIQRVKVMYRGQREVTFVTFLVDGVLRGLASELPYLFPWDADASVPGKHALTVRAYDANGLKCDDDTITVTTTGGKPVLCPTPSQRQDALQQRMLLLTLPTPAPLSLYTSLGLWHLEMKDIPQAISALEKSAAIDPKNETVLGTLRELYKEQGLHAISPSGDVTRGPENGRKRVALTFDDGPNPLYTPSIMTELAHYDAHATFFLVGKMVQRYPDLTLQLLANGHELANHTYHHPNLTKLTSEQIVSEMLLARTVIKDVTGRDTYLFRPPGGNIDGAVTRELRTLDYNTIYWSVTAGDYKKNTPAQQATLVLDHIHDGSIVLLHNGPVDGTLTILPTLLAELYRRGYTCVTVSELMKDR